MCQISAEVFGLCGHAEQALAYGLATRDELGELAAAWLRWAAADDGWLGMLHGELLIRVT